ncbi:hypothetical protein E2542_SST07528 [Spatholobus suberectus]|nr:hypothetical protein E2542_SST07528 [Spatholobus suberectus]
MSYGNTIRCSLVVSKAIALIYSSLRKSFFRFASVVSPLREILRFLELLIRLHSVSALSLTRESAQARCSGRLAVKIPQRHPSSRALQVASSLIAMPVCFISPTRDICISQSVAIAARGYGDLASISLPSWPGSFPMGFKQVFLRK